LTENIPHRQPRLTILMPSYDRSTDPGVCSVFVAGYPDAQYSIVKELSFTRALKGSYTPQHPRE